MSFVRKLQLITIAVFFICPAARFANGSETAVSFSVPFGFWQGVAAPAANRRVFVTSTTSNGNLGGLTGANNRCQTAADGAGLGGTWKAIIYTNGVTPDFNLQINEPIYNLRPSGSGGPQLVANDAADFFDGSIAATISYDENTATQTGYTWTGSVNAGGGPPNQCANFTSSSTINGQVGDIASITSTWLDALMGFACNNTTLRLYCMDGQPQANLPGGPNAVPASSTAINIYWLDNSTNETGFEIERSANGSTGWTVVNTTAVNVTSWQDTGLTPGETWFYRMRTLSAAGNSNFSPVTSATAGSYQRIFTTSTSYNGSVGGQPGADAACQSRAAAFALGGTWRALISAPGMDVKDYILIEPSLKVHNLRPVSSMGPQVVATSEADLWDGSIANGVVYSESGGTGQVNVWTGSSSTGTTHASSCDGFSGTSGSGRTGIANFTNTNWFSNTQTVCTSLRGFYCIDGQKQASGLIASTASSSQIDLYWLDNSTDELDFRVERSLDGLTGWTEVTTVAASGTSSKTFSNTGLSDSTTYYYRIRTNFTGVAKYSNIDSATTGPIQRIFVTSTQSNGNHGGLSGANSKCATRASSQGLGGTWKAVLSDATYHAASRIAVIPGRKLYNLRPLASGGRQEIAADAIDLWDGTLTNAVNYSELGTIPSPTSVWSGTTSAGIAHADHCTSWSTTAGSGYLGNLTSPTNWNNSSGGGCSTSTFRLYCIDGQEYPAIFYDFSAVGNSSTTIKLDWLDSENETGYEIERSADGSTGWTQIATPPAGTVTYIDGGLTPGATWYYRVRATNAAGASNWTNVSWSKAEVPHRLFVTSTTYDGNLGGQAGADAVCNARATAASLGGSWKGLVSTTTVNVKDHVTISAMIVNLRPGNIGGPQPIAVDATDLWDGTLLNSIGYTELGGTTSAQTWTGSVSAGTFLSPNCTDWTSNSSGVSGRTGSPTSSTGTWMAISSGTCNIVRPFFCLEQ